MAYNPFLLGQTTMTGSAPVVIASDQSPVPVDLISSTTVTVNIGNFSEMPTTVAVNNFPGTQPVSGTVTANQGANPWQVTNTTAPYGTYNPVVPSLTSLASGVDARLHLDQQANLLTNLATVSAPIPVQASESGAPWTVTGSVQASQAGAPWTVNASLIGTPAVAQSGAPWTVNASVQGQVPVAATVATLVIGLMPPVTANVVSTTTTVFQGGAPWLVNASVVGTPAVAQANAPWSVTATVGVPTVNQGTSPWLVNGTLVNQARYTPAAFSLASLAAGTYNSLQEDVNGNLLTNLATVSAPIPVSQNAAPWTINASIQGQVPVAATVATLVIGLMPAISVTATNTTVFQGGAPWTVTGSVGATQLGAPWTVNASIQGIPAVSQSGAPWTANVSVQGIPGVTATYAAPWVVAATIYGNVGNIGPGAAIGNVIASVSGNIPSMLATTGTGVGLFGAVELGQYSSTAITIASNATYSYYPAQLDQNGNQKVVFGATSTVSVGNVAAVNASIQGVIGVIATVLQGTNPWLVNASVVGQQAVTATVAAPMPVVATYAVPWNVTATIGNIPAVTQSGGPWTVTATVPNNVNTVGIPVTSGGLSIFQGNLSATVATIKSTAGQIYGYHIFNNNATQVYVNIYNITTATVGLTAVAMQLGIPASGGATWDTDIGIAFTNPMIASACVSTGGVGTPTIPISANIYYK